MKGIGKVFVIVAALVLGAGSLMMVEAAMPDPIAYGARRVAFATELAVHSVADFIGGLFGRDASLVAANVQERQVRAQGQAQQGDEFTWEGSLDIGSVIEIKGVNGSVLAERASGSRVEVRAVKQARRSDASEVRIEVVEHSGGVTLCAVYPSRGRQANECAPGDGGRMNVRNNDTRVTFYVKVPAGVEFHGKTVNGDVEALDLQSDILVRTVNGDVEVSTSGFAEATTVNGSIAAAIGTADRSEGLRFTTVNGSITLDLPDDVNADVSARWVNGGIETVLPLELLGRISRGSAQGVLGEGGPHLELETVNGSIRIR
jgi:hypothetical protein